MIAWITLVTASVLTLALRAGPSFVSRRATMPKVLHRANQFTVAGLMGALASRGVASQAATSGGIQVLAAVAVAVPVALRTRSMTTTMATGASAYLLVTMVLA